LDRGALDLLGQVGSVARAEDLRARLDEVARRHRDGLHAELDQELLVDVEAEVARRRGGAGTGDRDAARRGAGDELPLRREVLRAAVEAGAVDDADGAGGGGPVARVGDLDGEVARLAEADAAGADQLDLQRALDRRALAGGGDLGDAVGRGADDRGELARAGRRALED